MLPVADDNQGTAMTTDTPWTNDQLRRECEAREAFEEARLHEKCSDTIATLERDLAECRAALAELVACKDAPRTAPMVGIHDYACPCTRLGKKSGPCNCLGKAAEARIGQAWATARALTTKEG